MSKVRKLQIDRIIRNLCAACGWLLFLFEWIRIGRGTSGREERILLIVLISSLLMIHTGMYFWVRHSKRLAARGKRGAATRYTSPVFSRDHLGRTLVMDDKARMSREIVVSIDGDSKIYSAAEI